VRNQLHYTFTPEARELIKRASAFLYSIKSINVETLRPEAIEAGWTEQVLKERNVKAPVGEASRTGIHRTELAGSVTPEWGSHS